MHDAIITKYILFIFEFESTVLHIHLGRRNLRGPVGNTIKLCAFDKDNFCRSTAVSISPTNCKNCAQFPNINNIYTIVHNSLK